MCEAIWHFVTNLHDEVMDCRECRCRQARQPMLTEEGNRQAATRHTTHSQHNTVSTHSKHLHSTSATSTHIQLSNSAALSDGLTHVFSPESVDCLVSGRFESSSVLVTPRSSPSHIWPRWMLSACSLPLLLVSVANNSSMSLSSERECKCLNSSLSLPCV